MGYADESLELDEATEIIRGIARLGEMRFSGHAITRLLQRNASQKDVRNILLTGTAKSCEQDPRTRHWKYRVEGRTVDDEGTAVTVIMSRRSVFIVTVFFREEAS